MSSALQGVSGLKLEHDILNSNDFEVLEAKDQLEKICSCKEFRNDPYSHLLNLMIDRSVEGWDRNDSARHIVIRQIPNFADVVGNTLYLKNHVVKYIGRRHDQRRILDIFYKSLSITEFKDMLSRGVEAYKKKDYVGADYYLRAAFTVFPQSKQHETYLVPDEAML